MIAEDAETVGLSWALLLREALSEEGFRVRLCLGETAQWIAQSGLCRCRDCLRDEAEPFSARSAVEPRVWERWCRIWASAKVLWPPLRRITEAEAPTEEQEKAALERAYRQTGEIPSGPQHRQAQGPSRRAHRTPSSVALGATAKATAKARPRKGTREPETAGAQGLDVGTSRPSTAAPSDEHQGVIPAWSKRPRSTQAEGGQEGGSTAPRRFSSGNLTLTLGARAGKARADMPAPADRGERRVDAGDTGRGASGSAMAAVPAASAPRHPLRTPPRGPRAEGHEREAASPVQHRQGGVPPSTTIEIRGPAATTEPYAETMADLRKCTEPFVEVISCHVVNFGRDEPVVRFRAPGEAEAALRALNTQQVWLGGLALGGVRLEERKAPVDERRRRGGGRGDWEDQRCGGREGDRRRRA